MDERKENETWSVKIDPEIKTSLQSMIKASEKTAGDFFQTLLATYETSKTKESLSDIRELNQLENHLARIKEVYVSMAKSRKDLEESNVVSVTALQDEVRTLKAEIHDVKESAKLEVDEAFKLADESDKQRESALAEFEKLKQDKERAEKQADATNETLKQQTHLITELEKTATNAKIEMDFAKDNAKNLQVSLDNAIAELTKTKNQAQIDVATATNEALKESAAEIKSLHDKIEALQNDKLKLTESLAQEREKVIKLESKPTNTKKAPAKKITPPLE